MDEINEPKAPETDVEEAEEVEETPEPTDDPTALKARIQRLEEKAIAQRERTRILRQDLAKAAKAAAPKEAPSKPTGELDETQLDYLDLKGISDSDEIELIQKVMRNTGQTVRQALKDEYVQTKLETLRKERDVKAATPSSTRRSQGPTNDVAYWVAKVEQGGEYPTDFALKSAVVNALTEAASKNKPSWH